MIIVENPEAHIHPRGQAELGKLMALAASCGVQLFIETHSDHIINGIRVAVKQGLVDQGDVGFHYFTKTTTHEKQISLRDDHGKDILLPFSKKIVQSPYVIRIINPLPFNPSERKFIKHIRANGIIEIVLTDTDRGLGLVVKTTGRNVRETKRIAEILQEKYY